MRPGLAQLIRGGVLTQSEQREEGQVGNRRSGRAVPAGRPHMGLPYLPAPAALAFPLKRSLPRREKESKKKKKKGAGEEEKKKS